VIKLDKKKLLRLGLVAMACSPGIASLAANYKIQKKKTLADKLEDEGFVKVGEFEAGQPFPTDLIPAEKGPLDDPIPGRALRIVDKSEIDVLCKPGAVYEVYFQMKYGK